MALLADVKVLRDKSVDIEELAGSVCAILEFLIISSKLRLSLDRLLWQTLVMFTVSIAELGSLGGNFVFRVLFDLVCVFEGPDFRFIDDLKSRFSFEAAATARVLSEVDSFNKIN